MKFVLRRPGLLPPKHATAYVSREPTTIGYCNALLDYLGFIVDKIGLPRQREKHS